MTEGKFVSKLTLTCVPGLVAVVVVGDDGDRLAEEEKWKDELLQPSAQADLLRWEVRPPTGTVR